MFEGEIFYIEALQKEWFAHFGTPLAPETAALIYHAHVVSHSTTQQSHDARILFDRFLRWFKRKGETCPTT